MSVAEKGSTAATIWPVSVLIATFLSIPSQDEISRCGAYVRNDGLLRKRPSFTIMSSRCTHVGSPTEPNGPVFAQRHRLWAATASERCHPQWELLAREEVRSVFLTARDDVLAVLFAGDRGAFDTWAGTLEPRRAFDPELHEVRL